MTCDKTDCKYHPDCYGDWKECIYVPREKSLQAQIDELKLEIIELKKISNS